MRAPQKRRADGFESTFWGWFWPLPGSSRLPRFFCLPSTSLSSREVRKTRLAGAGPALSRSTLSRLATMDEDSQRSERSLSRTSLSPDGTSDRP